MSLDTQRIDQELLNLIRGHVDRGLTLFNADSVETFKPEIEALLSSLLWYTCIWKQRPTPGMRLLGLRYHRGGAQDKDEWRDPSKLQRMFMGVCMVLAPWFVARVRRNGLSQGWPNESPESPRGRMWRWLERVEGAWKFIYLANLLAFLRGRHQYPSVADSVTGMQQLRLQVPSSDSSSERTPPSDGTSSSSFRDINFQFMNRELMWDSLTSFALFAAPGVNRGALTSATSTIASGASGRVQRGLRAGNAAVRRWGQEWRAHFMGSRDGAERTVALAAAAASARRRRGAPSGVGAEVDWDAGTDSDESNSTDRGGEQPDSQQKAQNEKGTEQQECGKTVAEKAMDFSQKEVACCVACGTEPATMPYVASCEHTFCYYCVKTACLSDNEYACPQCRTCFETAKPWAQFTASK